MSWDSMNGRFRSHSCGGRGPQSGLLLSRTPVYMIVGVPSESAMQHPARMQAPLIHGLAASRVRFHPLSLAMRLKVAATVWQALKCCKGMLSDLSPEKHPSASRPPGVGMRAGGRCSQCTRSELTAWPQTIPKSHSHPLMMCW